jgi:hypothetical protein
MHDAIYCSALGESCPPSACSRRVLRSDWIHTYISHQSSRLSTFVAICLLFSFRIYCLSRYPNHHGCMAWHAMFCMRTGESRDSECGRAVHSQAGARPLSVSCTANIHRRTLDGVPRHRLTSIDYLSEHAKHRRGMHCFPSEPSLHDSSDYWCTRSFLQP